MKLRDNLELNRSGNRRTLHEISLDNNEPMTDCQRIVLSFDLIKRHYLNHIGLSEELAKSVDALFQIENNKSDDGIYMVEFKNGDIQNRDIERKVRDSLLIFNSITNSQIDYSRGNLHFVLVYNSDNHSFNFQSKKAIEMANRARTEFDVFGLKGLRNCYFKSVRAYNKKEFRNNIERYIENIT